MSTVGAHKADEPGYIVAWRSRVEFHAGKMMEPVMTSGEAHRKAAELQAGSKDKVYWAEALPQKFAPH